MKRIKAPAALAAVLLALTLAVGCAGSYFLNAGPDPARVRVILQCTADRAAGAPDLSMFDDVLPDTYWDWGLYLVRSASDYAPLAPADGQQLKVLIANNTLQRDTVFLVPPGKHTLRLIVEGYIKVRNGWYYDPRTIAGFGQEYEVDLKPGQTMTIRAGEAKK